MNTCKWMVATDLSDLPKDARPWMPHPAPPTPRARRWGQHLPIVCRHRLLNRAGCWLNETKRSPRTVSYSQWLNHNWEIDLKISVHYQGCKGATCREIMSLQPAPRAQMTSWPTGSVALLKHKCNLFDPLFSSLWIDRGHQEPLVYL